MTPIRFRWTRSLTAAATFLSILSAAALLTNAPLDAQVKSRMFFRPSATPGGDVVYRSQPIVDRLCKMLAGQSLLPPCPATLSGRVPARHFQPPLNIAADLPHLRMDLVVKRVEHKVVSGGGVQSSLVSISEVSSAAATSQFYDQAPWFGEVGLAVPDAGQVLLYDDWTAAIYEGIVSNGCSPATVFDVHLMDKVGVYGDPDFGHVDLHDSVTGNGYYIFAYTLRATDGKGVSDFLFSGDANVYCTGQASF